jgi:hypothetical protein
MKKKFLFIHIAKTGGSSVRQMLNKSIPKIEYDCIHNGKLISFQNNQIVRKAINRKISTEDYAHTAYIVRNPYVRLLSCYKYFHGGGLNQFNANMFQGDKQTQELIKSQFPSFQDCCHNLKGFCEVVSHARPMFDSIYNSCILAKNRKGIIQGRFESYNESVINIFSQLGLSLDAEDVLKVNLSSKKDKFTYDDSMKNEVYKFYRNDFDEFNYER